MAGRGWSLGAERRTQRYEEIIMKTRHDVPMRRHPLAAAILILSALVAGNLSAQGFAPNDQRGGYAQPRTERPAGGDRLDELMAWERQDAGVRPTRELHSGAMHGPTPNQIPGGQVITTKGLLPLLQQGIPVYVFDVLGAAQTLPNAIPAEWAAQPGSFDDPTQQQFAQMLAQVTRGDPNAPLVFYCQGPQCWMSYNAALRAIALGYRNVLWYRGGMEAWNHAGQRFAPRRG
jgi:PQQ-dependent catabolism-associated CXXCW motif protein